MEVDRELDAAGASDGNVCTVGRGPVYAVAFTDPDGRRLTVVRPNPDWTPDPGLRVIDADLFQRLDL